MMDVYAVTTHGFIRIGACRDAQRDTMASGVWEIASERGAFPGLPSELVRAANPPKLYRFAAIMKPRSDNGVIAEYAYVYFDPTQISAAMDKRDMFDIEIVVFISAGSPHPRWLPEWKPDADAKFNMEGN